MPDFEGLRRRRRARRCGRRGPPTARKERGGGREGGGVRAAPPRSESAEKAAAVHYGVDLGGRRLKLQSDQHLVRDGGRTQFYPWTSTSSNRGRGMTGPLNIFAGRAIFCPQPYGDGYIVGQDGMGGHLFLRVVAAHHRQRRVKPCPVVPQVLLPTTSRRRTGREAGFPRRRGTTAAERSPLAGNPTARVARRASYGTRWRSAAMGVHMTLHISGTQALPLDLEVRRPTKPIIISSTPRNSD
jgi:hypothetical protein